jgi:hypothetical protein
VSPLVYQAEPDESEDAEFLGNVLGTILNPVGTIASTIGQTLFPPPARKPPVPTVVAPTPSPGVTGGTISTPAGNATIRLPESVVSMEVFRRTQDELTSALNMTTQRLRATEADVNTLRERVATVVSSTQADVERVRREHRESTRRLRRTISNQSMMSMIMGVMASRRQREEFESHTHPIAGNATGIPVQQPDGDNNAMLMLLPMMMGQGESREDGDGGADNSMMGMAMAMAFM